MHRSTRTPRRRRTCLWHWVRIVQSTQSAYFQFLSQEVVAFVTIWYLNITQSLSIKSIRKKTWNFNVHCTKYSTTSCQNTNSQSLRHSPEEDESLNVCVDRASSICPRYLALIVHIRDPHPNSHPNKHSAFSQLTKYTQINIRGGGDVLISAICASCKVLNPNKNKTNHPMSSNSEG